MNRRWIAIGIAVVLSIPLGPLLITGVEHLVGTDVPLVFPGTGWTLETRSSAGITGNRSPQLVAQTSAIIPGTATAASYSGAVMISKNTVVTHTVPISLTVRNAMLPDAPSSKTMLFTAYGDLNPRYGSATTTAVQNQIMVAHRHKVSLIDDNFGQGWSSLQPASQWLPFLSGSGFTPSNGYAGPGVSTGQGVFSIGTSGGMTDNSGETQISFTAQFNSWESWFEANSPSTERFVYLCDEINCQNNTPTLATQLQWWQAIGGAGHNLHTLATQSLSSAAGTVLSDPTSHWNFSSQTSSGDQTNANTLLASEPTRLYAYNGGRPGGGSTIIEDEGTSIRELPWRQYKKHVDRSFSWETTYYNDYQRGRGNTNVFATADTFGQTSADPMYGQVGGSNGNGVTFYPGTDAVFPADSYGISGPIVSLRLKHWRRGIQDVDYLTLANAINPTAVTTLVNSMVPQALWENQCHDLSDCSYFIGSVSRSNKPDSWESARSQLAEIIKEAGWYSLDLEEMGQRRGNNVGFEFESSDGKRKQYRLVASAGTPGERVAWIYFNRPGLLSITKTVSGEQPKLHGVGLAELISRSRDIAVEKAELTVFLLCEVLPISVWVMLIFCLRRVAYWAVRQLPRPARTNARHEIEVFLSVAKWAGVGCYAVWTAKDVLAGIGIVFVG